jgi:hypothetical protein
MRLTTGLLASLCIAGLIQSFTPPAQAQTSASASSDKPELTADDKRLISQGYKLKYNKGTKVFCKMETAMGSRFEHSVCATAEEIARKAEMAQDGADASRRINVGGTVH